MHKKGTPVRIIPTAPSIYAGKSFIVTEVKDMRMFVGGRPLPIMPCYITGFEKGHTIPEIYLREEYSDTGFEFEEDQVVWAPNKNA